MSANSEIIKLEGIALISVYCTDLKSALRSDLKIYLLIFRAKFEAFRLNFPPLIWRADALPDLLKLYLGLGFSSLYPRVAWNLQVNSHRGRKTHLSHP